MNVIDVFNRTISDAINKNNSFYQTWFGKTDFTPEIIILDSGDFNCGAICNEFEFARRVADYYIQCLDIDFAESDELENIVNAFIDLPRRGNFEDDSIFRNRYKFIVVEKMNFRRTTRWAILDAISYFVSDMGTVQLVEPFDSYNCYFQIRFEGIITYDDIIFLNNLDQGWIDQNFIGGESIGTAISFIAELISRIKAAGIDYDILFIIQDRFTKTSYAIIGSIQIYKQSDSRIKAHLSFTKNSDATITV